MKICVQCGSSYEPDKYRYNQQKYCSSRCREVAARGRKTKASPRPCLFCGVELPAPRQYEGPHKKFCNPNHRARYYYHQNPEKYRLASLARYARDRDTIIPKMSERNRKRLYGLDPDEFRNMLIGQAARCACCDEVLQPGRGTHVDHDHVTGKIRALLCSDCNLMIGNARDNIKYLASGIRYLQQFAA